MNAARGRPEAAVQTLVQLLTTLGDDAEKADAYYWIWRLDTGGSEHQRNEALHLYDDLYRKTLTQIYRGWIDELSAESN